MNILIAGSKGFIGSHLYDHFGRSNPVIACDIHPDNSDKNYRCIKSMTDYDLILKESSFDLFINASGSSGVGFSFAHPEKDRELNTTNVELMLGAIKKNSPQTKFINFSSAAVYGDPQELPIKESAELKPLSPYGKNKLETENLLLKFNKDSKLKTCNVRVFSVYGPGLHKQLFWDLYQKAQLSNTVKLFGTGKESRDFIFVNDLVKAIELISRKTKFEGEAVNVASGIETTIREASQLFLDLLENKNELEFSGEVKEGDPLNWRADVSVLTNMGFSAKVSMKEGLKEVVKEFKAVQAK